MKLGIKERKKTVLLVYIISMLLPVVIFLTATAASGMLPGQKYYFLYGDGEQQFSIFSKAFVERLFSGKSLLYSFDLGMGMPTVALYAFYALSPFNIFFYLIKDVEVAAVIVICSKLAGSSGAMCFLIRKWIKADGATTVIFSMAYGLCSFFSAFYESFELLDMLYVMPLLAWGIIRLVRTGKWGKLCLVYAYSFTIHFYTGYITGMISFVLLISYSIYTYGKNSDLWIKMMPRYGACVLIAAFISAPVTLPAAIELFSMRAADVTRLEEFATNPFFFLRGFYLGQTQDVYNDIPMMYCGLPLLLYSLYFLLDGSETKEKRLVAVAPVLFLVVCSFIEPLYILIHGFDAPDGYTYRFSWMINFCMVLMSAYVLKKKRNIEKVKVWIISVSLAVLFVILYFLQQELKLIDKRPITGTEVIVNICLLLIYAMILPLSASKERWKGRLLLGGILVLEMGTSIIWGQADVREEIFLRQNYHIKQEQTDQGLKYIAEQEMQDRSEFYRIHYLNSLGDNISMLYGFKGFGWFTSVENAGVRKFMQKCGYAEKNLVLYDYGSTDFMQMLWGQKYSIECVYFGTENMNYFDVEKNEYCLPLGYMVADTVKEVTLENSSPFEIQNSVASALCGERHAIFRKHEGGYQMETDGLELQFPEGGMRFRRTAERGRAQLFFKTEMDGKVYAYAGRWGISVIDHGSPLFCSEIDMGGMNEQSRMSMPHILPLRKDEDDICRIYISMPDDYENYDFETIYLAYEDAEEVERVYSELSDGGMEIVSFQDEEIRGHISVGREKKILFTSIPYQKNWKVYVDGIETDTIALLEGTFLGVELKEGEHEVIFRYQNEWVTYGLVLGLTGMLMFLFFNRKKKEI